MAFSTIILAAGQGKRMHSKLPKVLHPLAGKALLEHVVETATELTDNATPIVVFGHEGEKVQQALTHLGVQWVPQIPQLGTGHAVLQALPHIPDMNQVVILYGDVPLITTATLKKLIAATPRDAIGMITTHFPDPTGVGRILRDASGKITGIVEEKDANAEQRDIREINSGIYVIPARYLKQWLPTLGNQNAQQEYYLTDIIALAAQNDIAIHSIQPACFEEVLGINDRMQQANAERIYQRRSAEQLMQQGVTVLDPNRLDIRGNVTTGHDVTLDVNVILEGTVRIGNNCYIGPNTLLRNTLLGDNVTIQANSVIDGADIGNDCRIGPFARLRPGTVLANEAHIGNFVEVKNSVVGTATKINHLSYIGDSDIGKHVNIGAGTITCNYDGVNKHKTIIGDDVFVGSNTQLVAPITIGEGATIGAGSTITENAPPRQLTLGRAKQVSIEHWERPKKKAKES